MRSDIAVDHGVLRHGLNIGVKGPHLQQITWQGVHIKFHVQSTPASLASRMQPASGQNMESLGQL